MEITYKKDQLQEIAQRLLKNTISKIFSFNAPMGAGKTTLIKAMLNELGAADSGHSPTFGIVNEYHDQKEELLAYHFDFYRLNDETEALDMGLEDYLNQDVWIFIEWPEKIASLIPENTMDVYMEIIDSQIRRISI